ncbi:MAG: F0F1 ATP synthase subunit B [Bacillaceae bacterium]
MLQVSNFVLGSGGGFSLNIGDILVQLLVFIVLLILLKKYAFKPLMGIMDARAEHISNEIDSAEKSNVEAKRLVEEQRELLKTARMEAQQMLDNAKKQADETKDGIIREAKAEGERLKEAATVEIQKEKEQAVAAIQSQVASLSVLIASKVIEKELKEEDQASFIQNYIKEAGEAR